MKRLAAASIALLSLAACSGPKPTAAEENLLENPLYAEWYYDDFVDHLVNLEIQNDPALDDSSMKSAADTARREALAQAKDATAKQRQGLLGAFVTISDETNGETLFLENTLFIGPDFMGVPGIDLHVYLSAVNDPRDAAFPDITAVDLGRVTTPYGAQSYDVPVAEEGDPTFRTVILYDVALKRIQGFAQIKAQ